MTAVALSQPHLIELKPLKPMALLESLLLFGIPATALAASLYWLWPALVDAGVARASAYVFSLSLVNAGLIVATLIGYRLEGHPWNWSAFSQRMRLTHLTGTLWLWISRRQDIQGRFVLSRAQEIAKVRLERMEQSLAWLVEESFGVI